MPLYLTDDKSTLVQVMAWCRQATSHYLSQCWPRYVAKWHHKASMSSECYHGQTRFGRFQFKKDFRQILHIDTGSRYVYEGSCMVPGYTARVKWPFNDGPATKPQSWRFPDQNNSSLIARFMGPTWDPPGADRTQVDPMNLAIRGKTVNMSHMVPTPQDSFLWCHLCGEQAIQAASKSHPLNGMTLMK